MTFVPGKGYKLTEAEGWTKVSEGALQYQKKTTSGKLGITHNAAPPEIDPQESFVATEGGIRFSMGVIPCYLHAIGEDVYLEFMDIS